MISTMIPRVLEGQPIPEGLSWKKYSFGGVTQRQHTYVRLTYRRKLRSWTLTFETHRFDPDTSPTGSTRTPSPPRAGVSSAGA